MAATTERRGASRTASQVGKRRRRASKARSRFRSLVFWERIVETFVEGWKRMSPDRLPVDLEQPAVNSQGAPPQSLHSRIINSALPPGWIPLGTTIPDG
jgi:hypothetical protein